MEYSSKITGLPFNAYSMPPLGFHVVSLLFCFVFKLKLSIYLNNWNIGCLSKISNALVNKKWETIFTNIYDLVRQTLVFNTQDSFVALVSKPC